MASLAVTHLGERGSYSHQAALQHFGKLGVAVTTGSASSFEGVVEAVASGSSERGILPVENSIAGAIRRSYDLLREAPVFIVGEEVFSIQHCLASTKRSRLEGVRRVLSHPEAFAQCQNLVRMLGRCVEEPVSDTATAARLVSERSDPSVAAICSEHAAGLHGLAVLATDVSDATANFTRFVLLSKRAATPESGPGKTVLTFGTEHRPGALLAALSVLGEHGLNLTMLDSRPIASEPWHYDFYLELEWEDAGNLGKALEALRQRTSSLQVLGSFAV